MATLVTLNANGTKSTIDSALIGGVGQAITLKSNEIDFGNVPVSSATFNIVDSAILATSTVLVYVNSKDATGRVGNDWEFDMPFFTAVTNNGSFDLSVVFEHSVVGKRQINYQII